MKPQGSLEKSREERELLSSGEPSLMSDLSSSSTCSNNSKKDISKSKRSKQNIALQSIFKKLEESKQVRNLQKSEFCICGYEIFYTRPAV